jgi:tetratricopeptide (TPR) repeat protein
LSKRKKAGTKNQLSGARSTTASAPRSARRFARLTLYGCLLAVGVGAALLVVARGRHAAPPAPAGTQAAPALALSPAEQSLRAALAGRPNDPPVHEALARYLQDEHRPFEALWHFRTVQDLQPNDANARVGIARALAQSGFTSDAIHLLHARSTVRSLESDDLDVRRGLAETALATARPLDALGALAGAGASLATSSPAQLLLGDARAAAGDMLGAAAAYRRVVALEPQSAVSYDRLGRLALASGQWAAARKAFAAAREREPQQPGPIYRLGLAAAGAGARAEAEQFWQGAAAVSPRYAPAHVALGRLYRDRKEWNKAAAHLVTAAKWDPGSEEAQLTLAEVMTAQGDRASAFYQRGFYDLETDRPHLALPEFRRMMAAAPDRVNGPLMTSLAYIQMERLDLAAVEAQRGRDRHPRDPHLLARLAQLHTISHNRPLARRLCEEWLRFDPTAAEPNALMGRIAREEHHLPEAVQFGERALAREPENAAACFQLSKTLSAIPGPENQRRALDLARQAVYRNPREADHWQQLGMMLRGAGHWEEAASAYLRALDLNPATVEACSLLVQCAAQEQRPETSRFFARLVTELEERARTSDALWRAVHRSPEDAAAHERLARHLLAMGDLRRARYQLQQVAALRPADGAARRDLAVVERLLEFRRE